MRPAAQIPAVTVSAAPAGCTASQRRPCTVPGHAHDSSAPSICRTEAAERSEQNTLQRYAESIKRRRNVWKRPKTLYRSDFPADNTPPERGSRATRTRYRYERRAAGHLHGHANRPAAVRIAASRPKVAKVADSRKVDSRRIVGKSLDSR